MRRVDKPHASSAAKRHAGVDGGGSEAGAESGRVGGEIRIDGAPEDDSTAVAPPGRPGEFGGEACVADGEKDEVNRAVDVVEGVEHAPAVDLLAGARVPRVDEVDLGLGRAPFELDQHSLAEAAGAGACPYECDRARLEHR